MCHEDWVKDAIADDSLVVELLLRLHQAHPPLPPPPPPQKTAAPCLHLDWTVRQRRSRSAPRHGGAAADKKGEPTRASPTTPLSWSGATSGSGGGAVDGSEESSRPMKPVKTSRSKVANNNPSETTTTRKSRRKKTLAELKEEENLLLKERRNLKNELASLRLTVEKHRAANESLKKMKLDLESRQNLKTGTTSATFDEAMVDPPQLVEAQCSHSHSVSPSVADMAVDDVTPVPSANASSKAQEIDNQEAPFMLPDLNLPVDEDLGSISIHGLS